MNPTPPDKGKGYNQTPGGDSGRIPKLSEIQIQQIIQKLKEDVLLKDIASIFKVHLQTISDINTGKAYYNKDIVYPIVARKYTGVKNYCPICGKEINPDSKYCKKCNSNLKAIPVPPKGQLLKDLYELQNCQEVANKYNISTVLLNKWRDQLNIPRKREDYIKLYEEEYLGIQREEKIKRNNSPKPILQIDPDTFNIVNEFVSAAEAGRYIGATNWTIIQQCQKFPKLYKKYLWKFKEKIN